jgi:hypothetical protein
MLSHISKIEPDKKANKEYRSIQNFVHNNRGCI